MEESEILNYLLKECPKGNFPTKEEETELISKYQTGDISAKNLIIKSYLRFVLKFALKYKRNGDLLDLVQEGNLGLLKSAETFDLTRGYRFLTYAVHGIRKNIIKSAKNQKENNELMSLDDFISQESENTKHSIVPEKKYPHTYDSVEKNLITEKIREHIRNIEPKYSRLISSLYLERKSIRELSSELNLREEVIRQRILTGKMMLKSSIKKDSSLKEFLNGYLS